MKMADDYLLQEIAGSYVLIPVGQNVVDYKKMIHFNETGYFIVSQLKQEVGYEELLAQMAAQYEAAEDEIPQLQADLDKFLAELESKGLLIR